MQWRQLASGLDLILTFFWVFIFYCTVVIEEHDWFCSRYKSWSHFPLGVPHIRESFSQLLSL